MKTHQQIIDNAKSLAVGAINAFPKIDHAPIELTRSHRRKWLQAVRYLREKSRRGWLLDKKVERVS